MGRTGTFIVIDAMMDMMHAEHKVDVFDFVSRIRNQRPQMVQTDVSSPPPAQPLALGRAAQSKPRHLGHPRTVGARVTVPGREKVLSNARCHMVLTQGHKRSLVMAVHLTFAPKPPSFGKAWSWLLLSCEQWPGQ